MDDLKDYVDLAEDINNCPWIIEKIKANKVYAQNLYAALCNIIWYKQTEFIPMLSGKNEWSCSWRWAGGFVAGIEGQGGDYMDWYCSGIRHEAEMDDDQFQQLSTEQKEEYIQSKAYVGEGYVAGEIEEDLAKIGWKWKNYEDDDFV
jgi:hypothetical protein